MSPEIQLKQPFPSRQAAAALRDQLVDYLLRARPAVGSDFLTDAELVRLSRLSRSTVRRALDDMHREGWIERRIGQGTYIGQRLAVPTAIQAKRPVGTSSAQVVRLAVLIFGIGDLAHDWYTPLVLEGIDESAERYGISVELIGNRERDVEAITRRIAQNPPDVLVCLAAEPRQSLVMRDAQRLGVRCVVTGTPHMHLGFPTIMEDNRQAMRLAMEHLLELGHHRIAVILERYPEPWVFERHEAYQDALASAGIDGDQSLVHWVSGRDRSDGSSADQEQVARFLERSRPTAVIPASYMPMMYLDRLYREGRINVPEQLSVVTMEQDVGRAHWLGDMELTSIRFPMREIGQKVAEMARNLVDQEMAPAKVLLPSQLVVGKSTRSVER